MKGVLDGKYWKIQYTPVSFPVDCEIDWTEIHTMQAIAYVAHTPTLNGKDLHGLHRKRKGKVKDKYTKNNYIWWVQKQDIKNREISPIAMILPKVEFRTIMDLSFKLRINRTEIPSTNEDKVPIVPWCLLRIRTSRKK